jgi:hypothetical protein
MVKNLYPKLIMVVNSNNHLSSCSHDNKSSVLPNTFTLKLYVVKEKVQNHTKSIERKSNKQILADPLTKGLPPNVFREHTVDMGLRKNI